jgi:hypothetical protein
MGPGLVVGGWRWIGFVSGWRRRGFGGWCRIGTGFDFWTGRLFWFGRSNVLALAVKVTFHGDAGLWQVLGDDRGLKLRSGGIVASLDGLHPRRWDRIAGRRMKEHGKLFLAAGVVGAVGTLLGGRGRWRGVWRWARREWYCPHTWARSW